MNNLPVGRYYTERELWLTSRRNKTGHRALTMAIFGDVKNSNDNNYMNNIVATSTNAKK